MLYVKSGRLTYCYNYTGLNKYVISSTQALASGAHQVRMEFAYDGGGLAKGGTVTLYIDGKSVGSGRVDRTVPIIFSADETSDVGLKRGSPITPEVPADNNAFTGTVQVVVVETDSMEEAGHLISRDELLHMLMARQ